jgi:tetratricopeptide (TPR) repeat protein
MRTAGEVLDVLDHLPEPYYALDIARSWLRSGDAALRKESARLLREMRQRYPELLQVGQWYVLALIETGDADKAEAELESLMKELANPDEELLARWGRLFRERGDHYMDLQAVQEEAAFLSLALACYRRALTKYKEAACVANGHYPRVNVAELYLIIASIESDDALCQRHLRKSRELADALLESKDSWPRRLPEDVIWHLATEAQVYLLLGEPGLACNKYHEVQQRKDCRAGHIKAIRGGAQRTLTAYRRLHQRGIQRCGWLESCRLEDVFP